MTKPSVLLIGDTECSEFRHARAALVERGRVTAAADVPAADAAVGDGHQIVDLIVVAQSYPGQFSAKAIDRLRRLAPLARVVGLLGSWCEGEMRTGEPWPGAIRVYWHQWLPRCRQELERLGRDQCSAWGLPATATEEDRLLWPAEAAGQRRGGLIAVCTPLCETADWLSAALRGRGYATAWLRPRQPITVAGATAAIFDATGCRGAELEEFHRLSRALTPAPIVALMSFPRIEDHHRALAAGAAAVLSKPLNLDDLFWQLDNL